jgi:hypothetical protein
MNKENRGTTNPPPSGMGNPLPSNQDLDQIVTNSLIDLLRRVDNRVTSTPELEGKALAAKERFVLIANDLAVAKL